MKIHEILFLIAFLLMIASAATYKGVTDLSDMLITACASALMFAYASK